MLFIMNADGVLTEYEITAKRERHSSTSSNSSLKIVDEFSSSPKNVSVLQNVNIGKTTSETPVRGKIQAPSQWSLQRYVDSLISVVSARNMKS